MAGVASVLTLLSTPAFGQSGAQSGAQSGPAENQVVIVGKTLEETLPEELKTFGSDVETTSIQTVRDAAIVDVGTALQLTTPGLFVAPRNGPFSYLDISLQGSRTQDMLFLVDGVRINNRLYSGTVTDTLPASMIERIEVLKGGQSLFYGTQAAAGVINVVTRGYVDDFDGMLTLGADTNEGYHADGYVRGKAGPGNYVLYASKDEAEGYETFTRFEPSATDRKRGYDVFSAGGKYRLSLLDDKLAIDARYQHTDADLDYVRPILTSFSQNSRDEDIASLGVDYAAADWLQVQVKGYWHDWDSHYTTIENNLPLGTGTTTIDDNLFWGYEDKGVNALAKISPGGPLEYVVGYDFQQYSGRDEVLLIKPQEEEVNAVYAQVRTTNDLLKNGAFAAGVRYNETGGSKTTVWNASGRYEILPETLYVQGVVGTSFLLPTAEQLYAVDPFDPLGNPNLEPEESKNINLSVGGGVMDNRLQWEITGFARDIDNLISDAAFADVGLNPATLYPDVDPSFYANGLFYNVDGKVEVRGFEVKGMADFGNGVSASASYTNSRSRMEGSSAQIARIPRDFAKASLAYEPPGARWGADASLVWIGKQLSSTSATAVDYGGYTVVNASAHVYLDAESHHRVTLAVENLFDEDYSTRVGFADLDNGSGTFLYGFRGVPQTLRATYSFSF